MWHRNRLTQLLIEKEEADGMLLAANRDEWYAVNAAILEPDVRATFYPSYYDHDTNAFINVSIAISNSLCLQLYYSMVSSFLSLLMSKTSINGLLNRGGMHIFSRDQLRNFVGLPDDWSAVDKKLLDIGAGDGGVTSVFREFYNCVYVVEVSKVMEWRLAQRGYTVLPLNKWRTSGTYDLITALNLLDRHFDPLALLADLHQLAIESNCLVLVSVVLPFRPYVEFNLAQAGSVVPVSKMCVSGVKFEDHVNTLIRNTFQPAGFELIRWTKLPYLCEGDMARAYYKLDDAVFLLRPVAKLQLAPPLANAAGIVSDMTTDDGWTASSSTFSPSVEKAGDTSAFKNTSVKIVHEEI